MKKVICFMILISTILMGCSAKELTGDIDVGSIDTGVYVKIEAKDIYLVEWQCEDNYNGVLGNAETMLDQDMYLLLTSKIGELVNEKKQAIDFTVTVKGKDGQVFSTDVFTYELGTKRMELIISKEGTMYS